jgi:hypothetical protein
MVNAATFAKKKCCDASRGGISRFGVGLWCRSTNFARATRSSFVCSLV